MYLVGGSKYLDLNLLAGVDLEVARAPKVRDVVDVIVVRCVVSFLLFLIENMYILLDEQLTTLLFLSNLLFIVL